MENVNDLEIIEGTVEGVVFQNEQTGYIVLEIDVKGSLVTAVGELGEVYEGEQVRLTGKFVSHQTYGTQFKAQLCERSLPSGANDIFRYLSSGVIKGVGAKTASAIVALFGDNTLEVIEKEPERLKAVKGVSEAKAIQIGREFTRIFGARTVMKELSELSIGAGESIRAYKKFGERAADRVRQDPYVLCGEDIGLPFESADAIAQRLGFSKNAPCRIRAGLLHVIRHNAGNGHTYLPKAKLISITTAFLGAEDADFEGELDWLFGSNMLVEDEVNGTSAVFLPVYHSCESYIAYRVTRMLQEETEVPENIDELIEKTEKELSISYARLQKSAVKQALTQNIFILTGGPGTGKTTALNGIISLFERQGLRVLLAAPTGRAAQRMSEVTKREAKTIHRLLEVAYSENDMPRFQRNEENPLKADLVIIDEISMVDVVLFSSLLKALPQGARLIMVGDSDQLPSVGAGRVLKDLSLDDFVPTVKLTEVFRQAAESAIVTNAHLIVRGDLPELHHKDNDFFFLKRDSAEKVADAVVDICVRRLPKAYGVSPLKDIQVLCPGRKGELGTHELNRRLQAALNPPDRSKGEHTFAGVTFRSGDRVMQIKNNYDIVWVRPNGENGLGVYNGDIGVITAIDKLSGTLKIVFDDREVLYPFDMLYELEHAYAVTVHKSQGSEYPMVILPLFKYFDKLYYRNLLYTAVTRAKDLLAIVGDEMAVSKMVQNNRKIERYTALSYFLKKNLAEYETLGF
ncbi:MAG: ATP-dependent RecD-like DNA helicase [Oscillospiraceae bacterium]|nr:ATP-dependent RecD-like DNA helicase [Oscillospiraceae bacterium]